jgi:hypothetical protein
MPKALTDTIEFACVADRLDDTPQPEPATLPAGAAGVLHEPILDDA